ncbi:unnamed protein product [Ectocarpus sp. 12 AP-2014]
MGNNKRAQATLPVPLRTTSLVAATVPRVSPTGPTLVPPAPLSPSSAPPSRLARPVRRAAFLKTQTADPRQWVRGRPWTCDGGPRQV